jgi:3-oxoacyl-[acyl-carrier protein] reductase
MGMNGKTAVITGGARGIGRAIALALAGRGVDIGIVDLEGDAAVETAEAVEKLGARAVVYRCDVASFEDVEKTGKALFTDFNEIDILVNNAGITRDRLLMRMTPQDWDVVLSVNLTGAFNFSKVLAPPMLKKRWGRIVNISSVIGLMGNAGQANYAASKAGLIGLTKALAKEFASRDVTVNAVAPGFIETAMTEGLSEEIRAQMLEVIPLKRFGSPENIADVVLFLLSESASYITGQVINCDGGMVMAR